MALHELDPRMPAVDGFAIALGRLSDAIDANWERATDAADPEGLHDLPRRAPSHPCGGARRAGRCSPGRWSSKRPTGCAYLTAATGPARDLDVLVGAWPRDVELPALLDRIEAARGAARTRLGLVLADPTATHWHRRWSGDVAGAPAPRRPGSTPTGGSGRWWPASSDGPNAGCSAPDGS